MRKVTAIFVALALIMAFAVACDKDSDETTTSQTIGTQYNPNTQISTTALQQVTENEAVATYVLTTDPSQTAPWADTTRFEFTDVAVPTGVTGTTGSSLPATQGSSDYDISFNVSEISKPNVNTSQASTMPKTTSDGEGNTGPTQSTTADESANPVQLLVNSYGYGDGVIYVEVDPSNWDGNFAAATQNITVKVNGVALGTSATCNVPSKKNGGSYEIKINLPSQDIEPGSVIDFTIPTGIVKNQSGSQYNLSYSASVPV